MMYQISYGPDESRSIEVTEDMEFAADRYRRLVDQNMVNVALVVEGMPLNPVALFRACQAHAHGFLRRIQ